MRNQTIPTLLGVVMLVAGIAAGVFLVQNRQIFKLRAEPETAPENIRVSNITDTSFDVSWTTNAVVGGFVSWGESESNPNQTASDTIATDGYTHSAAIKGLVPSTTYFFTINSGGDDYDNSGIPWQVTVGPILTDFPSTEPLSGSVLSAAGDPVDNALVYVTIGGAGLLSTTTSQSGNWVVPISSLRTQDLSSFFQVDEDTTPIEITVQTGPEGVSSAQTFASSARPVPPMVLGQAYDFKDLEQLTTNGEPVVNIKLPDEEVKGSKFDVSQEESSTTQDLVTVVSLDEGEVITSTTPEFFGEGPTGAIVTITVESDPVTDNVTVNSSGNWNWSPPKELEEGVHKLTLSWRDENGILRTVSRSFVVQAAEGPAFESTPSSTPSNTPSPTPTLRPSPTPTSSPSPLPDAGTLTPTLMLFIMSAGVLLLSSIVAAKAFSKDN
jgi:hypothetical protein